MQGLMKRMKFMLPDKQIIESQHRLNLMRGKI